MRIESLDPIQPVITIDGEPYVVNIKEYESLVNECQQFMTVENNGFELMTQVISDHLLDCAGPNTSIEELRPQLKFLREVGFFLKGIVTPLSNPAQT